MVVVFHVIGTVAEFEKDIFRERVKPGRDITKRRGKRLDRPPVSDVLLKKANVLQKEGLPFLNIGKQLGIDEGTDMKRVNK